MPVIEGLAKVRPSPQAWLASRTDTIRASGTDHRQRPGSFGGAYLHSGGVRGCAGLQPEFLIGQSYVLLDEFCLASAFVDDEADAERELVVVGEEANLLRDAVFDYCEVILG